MEENEKDQTPVVEKIISFFELCLFALGTIGGAACGLVNQALPVAIGVLFLAWAAFPKVKEAYNKLIS